MKSHPCRVSVKAFGAVSVDERPRWHFRFAERFNSQTYLDFLKQIVRGNVRNVFLVADNVGYHKSHAVQEWIAANPDRIELHYLPAYSPELNPVEGVWRITKRKSTHNRYFATKGELHEHVFRRFNRFQGNPVALSAAVRSWVPQAG